MLIVPALLPPPAPFKIFVLLAGVVAIPVWQFVTAIFVARIIRYGGEGLLAVWYGEQAMTFLHDHAGRIGLGLAGAALIIGGAWILWQRRSSSPSPSR
jgi:membrane protein DedA with SNARE-associated domain